MSELKVNEITGLGGSVKINDPVGMGAVARSGYQLNTNGKINVEGSVEVVTVPASNFGVRIRAPINSTTSPGFGDSTLQFTNNQGTTEWASIHAKSDASLDIRTDGDSALTINNAQTINHLGASLFNNTATFNNPMQVNSQATFINDFIPRCGGVPTVGDHLANKTYVDANSFKHTTANVVVLSKGHPNYMGGVIGFGAFTTVVPSGSKWLMCWWNDGSFSNSNNDNETFIIGVKTSGTVEITGNGSTTFGDFLNTNSGGNSGLGGRWAICFKQS